MESTVLQELADGTLTLTLNRPAKHNCINRQMLSQLEEALIGASDNSHVRVVIVRGSGEKSFCTGGDLSEFRDLDREGLITWIKRGNAVFDRLESLPKPTIAVIQGYAYGGGLELALACDFRIAASAATFASPEARLGWIPGWRGISRLYRIVGEARTKEIVLLGEKITASEALSLGLVNRVVKIEELDAATQQCAKQLGTLDPAIVQLVKSALPGKIESRHPDATFEVLASLFCRGL